MHLGFVTIHVKDLISSISFYEEILEFKEVMRFTPEPGTEIVFLQDTIGGLIELIQQEGKSPSQEESGPIALGIEVDSLETVMTMLKEKNIPLHEEPREIPGGLRYVFIKDPNGVTIQFLEGFHV